MCEVVECTAKLNDKRELFVQGLIKGLSQRKAYKEAFNCRNMTDKTIDEKASRLFWDDKVQARFREIQARIIKEAEDECVVTVKDVLRELKLVAFCNGSDYAKIVNKVHIQEIKDKDGNLVEIKEIPYQAVEFVETDALEKTKLAAIAGIKRGREGMEVKLNDKLKALELIGKHLNMFDGQNNEVTADTYEKLDKIMQSLDNQARGTQ